jgi:hypothetical protein
LILAFLSRQSNGERSKRMKPFDTRTPDYQAILADRARAQLLCLIETLTLQTKAETERLRRERLRKYDPGQPRVPRGHDDGGQWTDGGGGSPSAPSSAPRLPKLPALKPLKPSRMPTLPSRRPDGLSPSPLLPKPRPLRVDQLDDGRVNRVGDPFSDALIVVPAARAARTAASVARVTAEEAARIARDIGARAAGGVNDFMRSRRISKAMRSVEKFLGGKPDPKDAHVNNHKDITIIKGNRQLRMDVRNPGKTRAPNGKIVPEKPHFHLKVLKNKKWVDATETHRFYFKDKGTKK